MAEPRERPILFSGAMVRAILDGRKAQTRRVVKPQPSGHHWEGLKGYLPAGKVLSTSRGLVARFSHWLGDREDGVQWVSCPYGQPGDRLWVRETWYCDHCFERDYEKTRTTSYVGRVLTDAECEAEWRGSAVTGSFLYYRADGEAHQQFEQLEHDTGRIWKPSIHMPRWASRLTLEVTAVRVARLHDISEADARAEGVNHELAFTEGLITKASDTRPPEVRWFQALWERINGADAWDANPWVWVVEFRRVETPAS